MKRIDSAQALKEGSDLWIVAPKSKCHWTERIDWYLNFQIEKAQPHKPAVFSQELQSVIEKWEYEFSAVRLSDDTKAPLMIGSSGLLPNKMTVVVQGQTDQEWITETHRVWTGLGKPSLRVFLPTSVSPEGFETRWPKDDRIDSIEFLSSLDV